VSDCTRYTVIGAGHGGKAMAADLATKGFAVTDSVTKFSQIQTELQGLKGHRP